MKFSLEWLSRFVAPLPPLDTLCEQLTMAGLEVEGTETSAATLAQVVVARITAVKAHPNADQLRVCTVDAGDGSLREVVCGAPNARAGMLGCLALPGALLVSGNPVSIDEIRGVRSHGMLCSAAELGLGDEDDGLLELEGNAVPGSPLGSLCQSEDTRVELGLTPNRGDCLSLLGVAREISALSQVALNMPEIVPVPPVSPRAFPIHLEEPELCPRYAGRVLDDVDASRPTPLWMRERLRGAGVRSISLVVDITNYVMLAVGQPLHAFDLDTLAEGVRVRRAAAGESLVLLDGSNPVLDETCLVIADHQRVLALAGVMGGRDSGVQGGTRRVFLESAWFDPVAIAGTARRLKLHTDASHRFERGVDPGGQVRAIEMATQLLVELAGAKPGPVTCIEAGPASVPQSIPFRLTRANSLLGTQFSEAEARAIFQRLHLAIVEDGDAWRVTPPSYRADLGREEDLVEELARLAGYANLPASLPNIALALNFESPETALPDLIRDALAGAGYTEAVTYSFIAPDLWELFAGDLLPKALANPISSEMAVMRATLVPGLLGVLAHNQKRQMNDQRIFEVGMVFREEADGLAQTNRVAGVVIGAVEPEQWGRASRAVDFFDVKQDVESLLRACNLGNVDFVPAQIPGLHPGATARLLVAGRDVGVVGLVHPRVCRRLELTGVPVVFELQLNALVDGRLPAFKPFSRFPSTRRDLAIVVAEEVSVAAVLNCIRRAGGTLLRDLQLFDVYRGQGIDSGKKSLALGLLFQAPSSTLVDSQVDALVTGITEQLRAELRASLRV
jgi:phenylalanyl-tRNA synthetase beta chain